MSPSPTDCNEAILALATLQLEGVITSYRTNFMNLREPGVVPEVVVTIKARDELAIERTKRAVQKVLEPHIKGVQVTVSPGILPGGGDGDAFQFGDEETE